MHVVIDGTYLYTNGYYRLVSPVYIYNIILFCMQQSWNVDDPSTSKYGSHYVVLMKNKRILQGGLMIESFVRRHIS